MYERVIHNVLQEAIDKLDASEPLLRRALSSPGYSEDEVDGLVKFWKADGKPRIVHSYARAAAQLPCWAVVLGQEAQDPSYLDHSEDAFYIDAVSAFIDEVSAEVGRPISAQIHRMKLTYQIFTYATNPDVTLAYHNILRSVMLTADKRLVREGFELPNGSGMDLTPESAYLPENVFARVWQITGFAHLLLAADLDLAPFQTRLYSRVQGIHIVNAVLGVDPHVTPVVR